MATAFTRQLGAEAGVQLNPLRDNSEIPVQDNSDQVFGIMMRATRGRIDKPFKVNRGNVFRKLGKGEQIRVSALNEAWVHVVEALNKGSYEAVVQRLVTGAAALSYIVAYQGSGAVLGTPTVVGNALATIPITSGGTGYGVAPLVTITGGGGTGASAIALVTAGVITGFTITGGTGYTSPPTVTISNAPTFAVASALPVIPFLFAVKHLDCHNDGIRVEFRAEEKRSGGVNVANSVISLVIRDADAVELLNFSGSLVSTDVDDYNNSAFLADIISNQTDSLEFTAGTITSIPTDSPAYGYDSSTGIINWAKSGTLVAFSEGGTAYTTQNYIAGRQALQTTPYNYAYISSGGSQAAGLLAQLAQLAFDTNRQLRFDIPGNLSVSAAITFVEQLNLGASPTAHLLHAFWSPLKSADPTGVNGYGFYGTATLNIAYANLRNAQVNNLGFAPKNYPIAGKAWPIQRTGISQPYTPTDQELSALARAKINPVLYETYSGGSAYVFRDVLTSALVESSLKKLVPVADMSTSIDDAVTRFGKDVLQLPMTISVRRMKDYLRDLFEAAESSGWLVPSNDPFMEGKSFKFDVKPRADRPYDVLDVGYWLRYDGTTRQIFVTQTLTK